MTTISAGKTKPFYPLIDDQDPILKQPLGLFDFKNPPMDPVELAHILAETMIRNRGMGLSSNQIGFPHRAFVMQTNPVLVCFNPKIVDHGDETIAMDEGCLSYPGLIVKITRPRNIRVRYTLPNGETETQTFQGLTARIFQHELDHMDGINFLDRAKPVAKDLALRKYKKLKKLNILRNKFRS